MAQSDGLVAQLIAPNGKKTFVQSIAYTTASGNTTLALLTDATVGGALIPKGATWVFQFTTDCYYILAPTALTATATNAVKVLADQQEYVIAKSTDGSVASPETSGGTRPILTLKGVSASGTCQVFVVI